MAINRNTLKFSTLVTNQPVLINFIHPYGNAYHVVPFAVPAGHRATLVDIFGKEIRVCFNQFAYTFNNQRFFYKNTIALDQGLKEAFDVLHGPISTGDIVSLTKNRIRSEFCAALQIGKLQASVPVYAEGLPADVTATAAAPPVMHKVYTLPNGIEIVWPLLDVSFNVPQNANPFATTARQNDGPYEYDVFSVTQGSQQQSQINTIYTGMFDSERKTTIQDLI